MNHRRLAHLSDLHLGSSPERAETLVNKLLADDIEHIVVTGDLTHQGAHEEFALFFEVFEPLLRQGRLTFIPGNHDRTGDDSGQHWMRGKRVRTELHDDLYLVCVDSTGPHNRSYFASHGDLCPNVLQQIDDAVSAAPSNTVVAVLLHHHLVPLPEESVPEWLVTRLGLPNANELELGADLLIRMQDRCDLVLHGHRHVPRDFELGSGNDRVLGMYNAGSSTELGAYRVFDLKDGRVCGKPKWNVAMTRESAGGFSSNVLPALQYAVKQLGETILG